MKKSIAPATSEKPSKLQFRIDLVLTVLFLVVIFFMGAMTVITDFSHMHRTTMARSRLAEYLPDPENYSQWDFLAARIRSVDDYLAENIYMAEKLGHLNSTVQYAMGKRLVNTGSTQMLKLNSGHLYDIQSYVSMEPAVGNIMEMRSLVPEGVHFLYVYEHPTIYSPTQMPEGYDVLDYSDELADEIVERISQTDINMLDSREILSASGLELSEFLMYTDQHWATRASLVMAQSIAEELSEQTGIDMHPERLDIDNFETKTYPKLFLGKYGQRVGTFNIDPDDITIFWPKEETNIHRYTNYLGDITDIEGDFKDSVIRWKYLEPDEGKTYNIKAYFDYGLTENYDIYHNEDGADCTILLLKDSYSASIGSFLSLVANEIYAVDMRRSDLSLEEWIAKANPDVVVVSYSLQMLRQDEYEFR